MNGIDILKQIRIEPKFSKLPIIVFTSAYVPNMIDEAFLAGATLVFNKATVTPRQMIDALHKALLGCAVTPDASPVQSEVPGPMSSQPAAKTSLSTICVRVPADEEAARSAKEAGAVVIDFQEKLGAKDFEFEADLRKEFVEASPEILLTLRKALQDLSKAQGVASRLNHLLELYRKVHAL